MSKSQKRNRKIVIITTKGFEKLYAAQSKTIIWNHDTKSCTLEALNEHTGISTHTLSKVHSRKVGVDIRTLTRYFRAFNLTLESTDYICVNQNNITTKLVSTSQNNKAKITQFLCPKNAVNWDIEPDISEFYGRTVELAKLQQWILEDRCRLIAMVGRKGIGKTWLAAKLIEKIQHEFKSIIYRNLQPIKIPSLPIVFRDFIDDLIQHLPLDNNAKIPEQIDTKIKLLMDTLKRIRCLLVLDNVEFVLKRYTPPTASENYWIKKHNIENTAYCKFLRLLALGQHQSSILLVSKVEPPLIQPFLEYHSGIRLLSIKGLMVSDIQAIFNNTKTLEGTSTEWKLLVNYYCGNPLILSIVVNNIQCLFDGSITKFLNHNILICEDIVEILNQEFDNLSPAAQKIIKALATQDSPISFSKLRSQISTSISERTFLGSLKSLQRRSIINTSAGNFSLPALLRDYAREFYNFN